MQGRYGVPMNIYHARLPHQAYLRRQGVKLSKRAKVRLRWFDYYLAHGKNVRLVCRHFGISQTTFYKWQERFDSHHLESLEGRSRRPHQVRQPQTSWKVIQRTVELRKENPGWSKYKLGVILRGEGYPVSDSTIGRILVRRGLNQRMITKRKREINYRIKRLRVPKDVDRQLPGSLVQVDTKYLVTNGKTFYQFTAIDVVTRLKCSRIFTSRGSKCGKIFLESMLEFYPFPVRAVQSDNGPEFLKEFHQGLRERGITHYFSYPKTPQQNSYVERVIQTDAYEYWYQGNLINDYCLMKESMEEWNYKYNHQRPHQALGYLTPWQYYQTLVKDQKGGDVKI